MVSNETKLDGRGLTDFDGCDTFSWSSRGHRRYRPSTSHLAVDTESASSVDLRPATISVKCNVGTRIKAQHTTTTTGNKKQTNKQTNQPTNNQRAVSISIFKTKKISSFFLPIEEEKKHISFSPIGNGFSWEGFAAVAFSIIATGASS